MAALIAARPFSKHCPNHPQTIVNCTADDTALATIELPQRMVSS